MTEITTTTTTIGAAWAGTDNTGVAIGGEYYYYTPNFWPTISCYTPTPTPEVPVSKKIKKGMHLVVRKNDGLVVAIEDSFEEAMDEAREQAAKNEEEYIVFAAKRSARAKPTDIEERDV